MSESSISADNIILLISVSLYKNVFTLIHYQIIMYLIDLSSKKLMIHLIADS